MKPIDEGMVGLQVHKGRAKPPPIIPHADYQPLGQHEPAAVEPGENEKAKMSTAAAAGTHRRNVEPQNIDYVFIKFVGKIVISIIMRFWALSGAAVLAILLLYWLYGGWLAFCLLCFAVTGILYHAGDWLLYHPDQPANSRLYVPSPKVFNIPFENLYLRTKDGVQINVVLMKHASDSSQTPTVIFLHGNAGNIGHRLLNARGLYNLGLNILMVEYRGYGLSDGTPGEEGLYLDAQAAFDFLLSRPDINHQMIVLFGRSLGGAVAVDLSCHADYRKRVAALILENTFTCIPETARVLFNVWLIKLLPNWCYKNKFNSRQKMKHMRIPTLFISGLADGLVPPWMMMELYQVSGSPVKRMARFESGTHNDTWQSEGYFETIKDFLNEILFAFPQEKYEDVSSLQSGITTIQMPPDVI